MPPYFQQITIIGIGLIGGSLAAAIQDRKLSAKVVGIDRDVASLVKAVKLGLIDSFCADWPGGAEEPVGSEPEPVRESGVEPIAWREAVKQAELIILAVPVGSLVESTCRLFPHVTQGTVITDVGSVKAFYLSRVEPLLPAGIHLVGGHPIAGTERSGVEAFDPSLFVRTRCILTPTPRTSAEALDPVRHLWREVGAEVIEMDPEAHDRALAAVSHLPHMVAYSLVNGVDELARQDSRMLSFPGGGFRDFTRVASSHPLMWRDICLFNRDHILRAIDCFQRTLEELKACIDGSRAAGLEASFSQARRFRERMLRQSSVGKSRREATEDQRALIVAIDGPAAVGKSTLGQLVAEELGFTYINTGSIYRAVAWKSLEQGIKDEDHEALERLSAQLAIEFCREKPSSWTVKVDGKDLSQELQKEEVGKKASAISAIPRVREALLGLQRRLGEKGGVVMDGRDIGTVIFPQAEVKFYLEAAPAERSRRRYLQVRELGLEADPSTVAGDLEKRDADDTGRPTAPLTKAADAIAIDTTHRTIEDVKEVMLQAIRKAGERRQAAER